MLRNAPGIPLQCCALDRRSLLAGSALAALLSILGGGARPARAQALSGAPPEVDKLAVRILVDFTQFAVTPGRKVVGAVEIDQFGWGIEPDRPPDRTLVSEFGLAMLAQSTRGNEKRTVLQDFAFTPTALTNNMAMLGVDPAEIDALVLSHGHYDHFGGMAGFLKAARRHTEVRPAALCRRRGSLLRAASGPVRRSRAISARSTAAALQAAKIRGDSFRRAVARRRPWPSPPGMIGQKTLRKIAAAERDENRRRQRLRLLCR